MQGTQMSDAMGPNPDGPDPDGKPDVPVICCRHELLRYRQLSISPLPVNHWPPRTPGRDWLEGRE